MYYDFYDQYMLQCLLHYYFQAVRNIIFKTMILYSINSCIVLVSPVRTCHDIDTGSLRIHVLQCSMWENNAYPEFDTSSIDQYVEINSAVLLKWPTFWLSSYRST